MADIRLKSVCKSYGDNEVIHDVDADIADGELIVVVGPSGCGKSTLLRMVAGLESVTSGDIEIDGKRVNDLEPMDRNVAMVFQNYALYPHMSVFDNMAYGLKIAHVPKAEIKERVHEAAKLLQIEEYLDRKPKQLSGGQRQRVAMGRAIVRSPKVFLFDEPLSNLDAKLRVQMRIEIKRLQRSMGVTSIYVTHDQTEAMTLADRLAVINSGRVEQMGKPMELYNDPQTLFVAGFIGTPQINMIRARFDGSRLVAGTLSLNGYKNLPRDRDLVLGIRPDELKPSRKKQLSMRVDLIEQHGADNLIYGDLLGGEQEAEICVKTDHDALPKLEDTIGLEFDPARAFVFDRETGDRIV